MSSSASASSAAITSASPTPSGTPTIVFASPATMYACQTARVQWNHQNSFDWADESIALYIANDGVDQTIPSASSAASSASATPIASSSSVRLVPSSSSSIAARLSSSSSVPASSTSSAIRSSFSLPPLSSRSLIPFNKTLEVIHPANQPFIWGSVDLPAGRYHIRAYANNPLSNAGADGGSVPQGGLLGTTAEFTILERPGSTSCLDALGYDALSESLEAASRTTSSPASSASASNGTGAAGTSTETSSKTSGGTIAGIVIGVVGGLAILATLLFCWRRRRRNGSMAIGRPTSFAHHDSGMGAIAGGRSRSRSANRLSSFTESHSGRERGHVQVGSFESGEKHYHAGSNSSHGAEELPMTAVLEKNRQTSYLDDGSTKEFLTPLPTAASSSSYDLPMPSSISPFASFADRQDAYAEPTSAAPSSGHVTPTRGSRQASLSMYNDTSPPRSPGMVGSPQIGVQRSKSSGGMQRKASVGRRKPVPQIDADAEMSAASQQRRPSPPELGVPLTDAQPTRRSYILSADPPVAPQ